MCKIASGHRDSCAERIEIFCEGGESDDGLAACGRAKGCRGAAAAEQRQVLVAMEIRIIRINMDQYGSIRINMD